MDFNWTIECTPIGTADPGITVPPVIFRNGEISNLQPSSWTLEQRNDAASTTLKIRFPNATRFMNAWRLQNCLAPGSLVVLKADTVPRFTGRVKEHVIKYNGLEQSVEIVCCDRMGLLADACVEMNIQRRTIRKSRFLMTQSAIDDHAFEAVDIGPVYYRPWKTSDPGQNNFLVPVWYQDITGAWFNIPFAEYDVYYESGVIHFRNDVINVIGGEQFLLSDIDAGIYADFVYYDPTDTTTTRISDCIRLAFETPVLSGGLGWTEGVQYVVTDETPGDILSGMKWETNLGDGDAQSFMSMLYDDPKIALAPSYWVRDFEGNGVVETRLVLQDPTWPKDINVVFDTLFPSPIQNIYTRVVLVNTTGTRENLVRDTSQIYDLFTSPVCPGGAWTITGAMPDDSPSLGKGYLCDANINSSFGYFKHGYGGDFSEANGDIPHDIPFMHFDLDGSKKIDIIHVGQAWTFAGDNTVGDQPAPLAAPAGNGPMRIYPGYQQMRFTVEYATSVAVPITEEAWHPIHPDLFHASVNDCMGGGQDDTHVIIENINTWATHLRVIINTPFLSKTSNSTQKYRMLFCWLSEFQVFGGGYVLDPVTKEPPEVKFTDDDDDPYRCMCNLAGDTIDLYRPTLLAITSAMGLKYRTLVIENDDVWDFSIKSPDDMVIPGDCDDVSTGYKYLVTMLDSNSKENNWTVNIDCRPDVLIGDTVMCTQLNPGKSFLVMGNVITCTGGKMTQTIELSDFETPVTGENTDEADDCTPF